MIWWQKKRVHVWHDIFNTITSEKWSVERTGHLCKEQRNRMSRRNMINLIWFSTSVLRPRSCKREIERKKRVSEFDMWNSWNLNCVRCGSRIVRCKVQLQPQCQIRFHLEKVTQKSGWYVGMGRSVIISRIGSPSFIYKYC